MIEISEQIANEIKGVEYMPNILCNPIQDVNGNWFVSELEAISLGLELNRVSAYFGIYEDGVLVETIFTPAYDYSLFNDGNVFCILLPAELEDITDKQYGSYYLPLTKDMNGNTIVPIWIAYDDNFISIWSDIRTLDRIKYKPIVQ